MTAAGIGSFDWNLVTGTLTWDARLIELFGYDETTFDRSIEAFKPSVRAPHRRPVVSERGQTPRGRVTRSSCGSIGPAPGRPTWMWSQSEDTSV